LYKKLLQNTNFFQNTFSLIILAGPGGRSLIEIQHLSGANIQISKKGIFTPGTRNRIVTITGPPNAITVAHHLIEQRITDEEAKRLRQTSLTGIMQ
jgi:RNA-binding protein Nova